MPDGEVTRFGFRWGPVVVSRLSELPGERVCIGVKTAHREIEVYATPGGRSLRVFSEGREWRPSEDA